MSAEHYWSRAYNSKERFCSFWHQLDEVLSFDARRVLEIGPGNGLVTDWLRRAGLEVITADIDSQVGPDVVAPVTALPFEQASFDVVLCAEILEHLPWDDSVRAMHELRRVARSGAVISLPDVTPWVGKSFPLYFGLYASGLHQQYSGPLLRQLRRLLRGEGRARDLLWTRLVPPSWHLGGRVFEFRRRLIPHQPWQHEFDGEHYYEIGTAGYPVERIAAALTTAGFCIDREFRVPENPWHHFFILRTTDESIQTA